ncbi:MAG TPA: Rv3235 family protein [Amycolatopsis sp.]|nr:Rv3235 family protein [Amycolatopsis sp.]
MNKDHRLTPLPAAEVLRRHWNGMPTPGGVRRRGRRRTTVPPRLDTAQVRQLLNTLLEAYGGHRPAVQVRPLVDQALFARLNRPRLPRTRYRVRRIHICCPAEGVVEAAALVLGGQRMFALAARIEHRNVGWRCTRFHVLEPETMLRSAA